ncbi:MAG: hypothetical protein RIB58_11065 [Phycisphaerales bacterium]|jgi:hypothetical protein
MNTMELIEMAVLDAMDMLEPDEAKAFEAAFLAAPPSVQERVRIEQARLANLERLLPDVSPDPQLRQRVISAVREAMLAEAVARASESEDDADEPFVLRKSRGVSRYWRIGAISGAAAAVALGVAFWQATVRYNELNERFVNNIGLQGAINAYGADSMDVLLRPHLVKDVVFTPVDRAATIEIALEHLSEKQLGFLHCGNLPTQPNIEYALVQMDANNQIGRTIHQFASNGRLTTQRLEGLVLESGMQLALISVNLASGTKQVMATTTITI